MAFLTAAYKAALPLVLAAGLLTECQEKTPGPVTEPTPPVPGTPIPPQYGTPFAGVPDRQDAAMYQVNMRAFSQTANFTGVAARLDSIKSLGVNVLYLRPIFPVGQLRAFNSPYAVKDYRAVNPEFGSLADLRALVDGAHPRNIAVMLDWVPNHTSWDHEWITAHPDWYLRNANGTILNPPNTTYTDVAQLNFDNPAMRLEMVSAMKSWVFTANVDGFRCDYADPIPTAFWQQAVDTLRRVRTHRLLLLAEGSRSGHFAAGFDYTFGFSFYDAIKSVYRNGSSATTLSVLNANEYAGATGTQQVVRYTTNHDVNDSDGTPVTLFGGNAGAMSAFVVASCLQGVPMVYNGQEAGMAQAITFPFTSVKVNWGANPAVTRAYRQLLAARATSVALRRGTPVAYSNNDVCAFTKTVGAEQAFVLANVRNYPVQYPVPAALVGTTWTNALQGGSTALGSTLALPPHAYVVLKR